MAATVNTRQATVSECVVLTDCLDDAFAHDPLIDFLFARTSRETSSQLVRDFFRILLEVRITLEMPCMAADVNGTLVGAAMGYNCARPAWPLRYQGEWKQLMSRTRGLEQRLNEYGTLAERFEPKEPHYYLGVIGLSARHRGTGIGKDLLNAFCRASQQDSSSAGVYLETASPPSLEFYLRNGFVVRGEGRLGGTPLWCVFRAT